MARKTDSEKIEDLMVAFAGLSTVLSDTIAGTSDVLTITLQLSNGEFDEARKSLDEFHATQSKSLQALTEILEKMVEHK